MGATLRAQLRAQARNFRLSSAMSARTLLGVGSVYPCGVLSVDVLPFFGALVSFDFFAMWLTSLRLSVEFSSCGVRGRGLRCFEHPGPSLYVLPYCRVAKPSDPHLHWGFGHEPPSAIQVEQRGQDHPFITVPSLRTASLNFCMISLSRGSVLRIEDPCAHTSPHRARAPPPKKP